MSYLEYYELNEEPFSNSINNKFFYKSPQHNEALIRLRYAVDSYKGLATLVGDIGTGKTTLAQQMLYSMNDNEYEAVLLIIIHNKLTAEWFLTKMSRQLGIEEVGHCDKTELLGMIYSKLAALHNAGKKVVVLIDEAQMLANKDLMEEFRGLLNIEMDDRKLITFILFGLPEIDSCLELDKPLQQRVAVRYELKKFSAGNSIEYINYRLAVAGASRELFTPEAIEHIHKRSSGIPRLINTIGDNALFEGFLIKKDVIDKELIIGVANDLRIAS